MEALLQANPWNIVDSWGYNQGITEDNDAVGFGNNTHKMTVVIGVFCLTLLFVMVRADGWRPTGTFFGRKARLCMTSTTALKGVKSPEEDEKETPQEAERRVLSRLPWWEDSWAEAFLNSFQTSGLRDVSTESVTDELGHYSKYEELKNARVLHFCFLLHGHRGLSTDLSYLQRAMQHYAEEEKNKRYNDTSKEETLKHDMIVHCAKSNEHKTMDGVVNGGERLVKEILQVIRSELENRGLDNPGPDGVQDITVSVVGNSLGGIYGRYAIAKLAEEASRNETKTLKEDTLCGDRCVLLDDKYRLHFNIFCTTATPHLGISKHTYVPLPRSAEIGVAHALGDTGRDLFRLNNLLKNMATCPTFLKPLSNFRKRIAYANAYGTDFPVPATTAAFLSDDSTYPHEFAEEEQQLNFDPGTKREHVVATLQTPQNWEPADRATTKIDASEEGAIVDDLLHMSTSLDSLGWKKVFVDIRKEIPIRVSIPRSLNIRDKFSNSTLVTAAKARLRKDPDDSATFEEASATSSSTDDEGNSAESLDRTQSSATEQETVDVTGDESAESIMRQLQQKRIVGSRDIAYAVSTPEDNRRSFPIGHNLMVAMSRDGQLTKSINKGGRPVMDALAKELVGDIFNWNFEEENAEAERVADVQRNGSQEAARVAETASS